MRSREPTEAQIQSAVIAHWQQFGVPDSLVAAIPNMNAHGQSGLTRGLPDLLVVGNGIIGFIELKTKAGKISKFQESVLGVLWVNGIKVVVTYGRDQPITILETWGIVKPSNWRLK